MRHQYRLGFLITVLRSRLHARLSWKNPSLINVGSCHWQWLHRDTCGYHSNCGCASFVQPLAPFLIKPEHAHCNICISSCKNHDITTYFPVIAPNGQGTGISRCQCITSTCCLHVRSYRLQCIYACIVYRQLKFTASEYPIMYSLIGSSYYRYRFNQSRHFCAWVEPLTCWFMYKLLSL